MARLVIGGLHHETNTFSPHAADLAAFETVSAFPRVPRDARLLEEMQDLNIGIGGFIRSARAAGHELIPTVWATAVPSDRSMPEPPLPTTFALAPDLANSPSCPAR